MNSYTFFIKLKDGRKHYRIPKAIIEREYGLPELDNYFFYSAGRHNCEIIFLKEHLLFKEKKDSRVAI